MTDASFETIERYLCYETHDWNHLNVFCVFWKPSCILIFAINNVPRDLSYAMFASVCFYGIDTRAKIRRNNHFNVAHNFFLFSRKHYAECAVNRHCCSPSYVLDLIRLSGCVCVSYMAPSKLPKHSQTNTLIAYRCVYIQLVYCLSVKPDAHNCHFGIFFLF